MTYRVAIVKKAQKQLDAIPGKQGDRISDAIAALADDPRPAGCRKLVGEEHLWRIRIGNYRVVYSIQDGELIVQVVRVAHRREVYR